MARLRAWRRHGRTGRFQASYAEALAGQAKDKRRATIEAVGGGLRAFVGTAGGPLGVAAGSVAGQTAAELYPDHEKDIHAWMDDRWRRPARAAGERVMPYTPVPRMNRALRR